MDETGREPERRSIKQILLPLFVQVGTSHFLSFPKLAQRFGDGDVWRNSVSEAGG
jgi:hypothetical protein